MQSNSSERQKTNGIDSLSSTLVHPTSINFPQHFPYIYSIFTVVYGCRALASLIDTRPFRKSIRLISFRAVVGGYCNNVDNDIQDREGCTFVPQVEIFLYAVVERKLEDGAEGGSESVDNDEDGERETDGVVEKEDDLFEKKFFFHGISDNQSDGFGGAGGRSRVFITFFILHFITYKYTPMSFVYLSFSDNIIFMNKYNQHLSPLQMRASCISLTTDSSTKNRFTRKPSHSIKKSRSKSKQRPSLQIPTSFLKSVSYDSQSPLKELQKSLKSQKNEIKMERGIMKQRQRRREPTPVKSRKQLGRSQILENMQIEWQIRATELEVKMMEQKKMREKYEKGWNKKNKELEKAKEAIESYQLQNKELKVENRRMEAKVSQLQKVIVESQTNLMTTKNNLEKLRQTIKQNRIAELQTENKKLKGEMHQIQGNNEELKNEVKRLQKSVKEGRAERQKLVKRVNYEGMMKNESMREQYLMKQIQKLKEKVQAKKQQKQKYLENRIYSLQAQLQKANSSVQGLEIKLRMADKKICDQVLELRRKKQAQLKHLRMKISKLSQQIKNNQPTRSLYSDTILFQLSPEK